MVVNILSSVAGLTRWVDYIPIAFVSGSATLRENSHDTAGYIAIAALTSLTGKTAGVDYLNVYLERPYTAANAWQVDSVGFIPVENSAAETVASLFSNNTPGVWFDASDFSTMFQDSAGTTPVTAVEQPVGRINDKSGRGNHATQATSASRPVLSARVNGLIKTQEFSDAVWSKSAIAWEAVAAPDGTVTAVKVTADGTAAVHEIKQQGTPVANSIQVKAKAGTARYLQIAFDNVADTNVNFDLVAGTYGGTGAGITSASITAAEDGYFLCTAVATGSPNNARFAIVTGLTATRLESNTLTGSLTLWHPDLRLSADTSAGPAYQRVNTATDYDTAGFRHFLRFDGVDDSLATGSINFTSTDKMTVFAGVHKASDAATGIITELSASIGAVNGAFYLANLTTSELRFASKGSVEVTAGASHAAPTTKVITGVGDISGDIARVRVNGTATSSTLDQGTGNYGSHALYVGRRGDGSLPFNGRLYSLIVRGAASTASEVSATESYVNSKTGAY